MDALFWLVLVALIVVSMIIGWQLKVLVEEMKDK